MYSFVGNCRKCGYSLVKLTEPRCPECGTPFDPDDPATMQIHPSRMQNFLMKKTNIWTLFPAFIACGIAVAISLSASPELARVAQVAAIVVLMVTLYIVSVRYRFQSWMKRRARQREKELSQKKLQK